MTPAPPARNAAGISLIITIAVARLRQIKAAPQEAIHSVAIDLAFTQQDDVS